MKFYKNLTIEQIIKIKSVGIVILFLSFLVIFIIFMPKSLYYSFAGFLIICGLRAISALYKLATESFEEVYETKSWKIRSKHAEGCDCKDCMYTKNSVDDPL